MTRKLPHVGLHLPDAAGRSMPVQEGLHWQTGAEREQIRRDRNAIIERMMMAMGSDHQEPIRVVAEVGRPIPEVEA